LQEDIERTEICSDPLNHLIGFALYFAGKRTCVKVRQLFLFLPVILACDIICEDDDYKRKTMLKITIIVLVILIAPIVLLALRFILVGKNTQQALDMLNKNLRQNKTPNSKKQ